MKKLSILCAFCFVLSALAYTSEDLSNANYLGEHQIIMKQNVVSKYGLDNKILRQEAIGIALMIKGIKLPENYTCKKYFTDVTKNDWVCRAVEIAADNGIISRGNKYANPGKYVTRAEALIMMMKAGGLNPEDLPAGGMTSTDATVAWQIRIIDAASKFGILDKNDYTTIKIDYSGEMMNDTQMVFSPNRLATRAEVFGFAKNIIQYQANISTGVTINNYPKQNNSKNTVTANGDVKSEIIIENGNLVLYENGQRKRQLTYDGVTTEVLGDLQICLNTESWKKNTYTYIGGSGETYLFDKRSYKESCESKGIKKIIVYKSNVIDLALKVNENFGVNFREIGAEILNNNQVKIYGFFTYDTDEFRDKMPPTTFISIEKIQQLGMLVVQEPIASSHSPFYRGTPGKFELTVNIDNL